PRRRGPDPGRGHREPQGPPRPPLTACPSLPPMRAMVMAAGLGTRLRPIPHEIPKPVVPVGNVAIVEQLVRLLAAHGVDEVIANLHWFPEQGRGRLGDGGEFGLEVTYRQEEELLGTAGGVRNVADF